MMDVGCTASGAAEISGLFLVYVQTDKGPHVSAFIILKLVKKIELSKWVKW